MSITNNKLNWNYKKLMFELDNTFEFTINNCIIKSVKILNILKDKDIFIEFRNTQHDLDDHAKCDYCVDTYGHIIDLCTFIFELEKPDLKNEISIKNILYETGHKQLDDLFELAEEYHRSCYRVKTQRGFISYIEGKLPYEYRSCKMCFPHLV